MYATGVLLLVMLAWAWTGAFSTRAYSDHAQETRALNAEPFRVTAVNNYRSRSNDFSVDALNSLDTLASAVARDQSEYKQEVQQNQLKFRRRVRLMARRSAQGNERLNKATSKFTGLVVGASRDATLKESVKKTIKQLDSVIWSLQSQFSKPFIPTTREPAQILGAFNSDVRTNFIGFPSEIALRRSKEYSISDLNSLTTLLILQCLVEATLYGSASSSATSNMSTAVESLKVFYTHIYPRGSSILTMWPEKLLIDGKGWVINPENIAGAQMKDNNTFMQLQALAKSCNCEPAKSGAEEMSANPMCKEHFSTPLPEIFKYPAYPPDFLTSFSNLALGSLLLARNAAENKSVYTTESELWASANSAVQILVNKLKAAVIIFPATQREVRRSSVNASGESVNKTSESVNKTSQSVNKKSESVNKTSESVNKTSESVNKTSKSVNKSLESVNKSLESVNKSLESVNKSRESHQPRMKREIKTAESKDKNATAGKDVDVTTAGKGNKRNESISNSSAESRDVGVNETDTPPQPKTSDQVHPGNVTAQGNSTGTAAPNTTANLTTAKLTAANLTTANLTAANLTTANLTTANLTAANLTAANLTAANLATANLTTANLTTANLTTANLTAANLTAANLTTANLTTANLTTAKLTTANLTTVSPATDVSATPIASTTKNITSSSNASTTTTPSVTPEPTKPAPSRINQVIDSMSYYTLKNYLDSVVPNGKEDVILIPSLITDDDTVVNNGKSLSKNDGNVWHNGQIYHSYNSVNLMTTATTVHALVVASMAGLIDIENDILMQKIVVSSLRLLSWFMNSTQELATAVTLSEFPSRYQLYWVTSRLAFQLNSRQAQTSGMFKFAEDALKSFNNILRGKMTFSILQSIVDDGLGQDGKTRVYVDDSIGVADFDDKGNKRISGDDRLFTSSMAVNALICIWTVQMENGILQFLKDIDDSVRIAVNSLINYVTGAVTDSTLPDLNAFMCEQIKNCQTFPAMYPANIITTADGQTVNPMEASLKHRYGIQGYVPRQDYQKLLDNARFGYKTRGGDLHDLNSPTSVFRFWSSAAYSKAAALLAISQAANLQVDKNS